MILSPRFRGAGWLVISIVCAISMAYYVAQIWAALRPPEMSDLYASWRASRELLLHHRDPYSRAVTDDIQTAIYGAPLAPTPDDPLAVGGGFVYPVYTAFLFLPALHASFRTAQIAFLCLAAAATLLSLSLWLRTLRYRLSPQEGLTLAFFVGGSFPVLQALRLQNLSLLAAALVAVAIFLLTAEHFILAGIFLAAATFKPQFTLALIPWMAIWTLSGCRRRKRLAFSFIGTMIVLLAASESLAPGWIGDFLGVMRAYRHYTYGQSLLEIWIPQPFGSVAAGGVLVGALALAWNQRSRPASSPGFVLSTSLVLAANVVVIPTLAPHAQILLLPGWLLLLQHRGDFPRAGFARLLQFAAWALLAWPWIAACILLAARAFAPLRAELAYWQAPLYASPVAPLALLLALGVLLRKRADAPAEAPVAPSTPVVGAD